jgi:pilus assembly protein Flp/PilA
MTTLFIRFAGDESGITAIEYGLIAGLIVLAIITAVSAVGTNIAANFYGPIANGL